MFEGARKRMAARRLGMLFDEAGTYDIIDRKGNILFTGRYDGMIGTVATFSREGEEGCQVDLERDAGKYTFRQVLPYYSII